MRSERKGDSSTLHNKILAGLIGSVLFLGTAMAQNQPVFSSVDYPGAVLTNAQGINPGGDVVGYYKNTLGKQHGVLFSEGNFTSIDYPGAISTDARGISPGGDIVGSYTVAPGGGRQHARLSVKPGDLYRTPIPRA